MMSPSTHTEVGAWMSEQNQGYYITSELATCPYGPFVCWIALTPESLINVCKFFNDLKLCKSRGAVTFLLLPKSSDSRDTT